MKKSLRFEVFARDGFICQYCGSRPPDVVLEVDHIHPRSRGGTDDIINLVTSCYDCNRGKRAKILNQIAPRPDADMAFMQIQQELAEAKRFLKAKKARDKANKEICDALRETWSRGLTPEIAPSDKILIPWINRYGADAVEQGIKAAIPSYTSGRFRYMDDNKAFNGLIPYVGAILRNMRDEGTVQ